MRRIMPHTFEISVTSSRPEGDSLVIITTVHADDARRRFTRRVLTDGAEGARGAAQVDPV